MQDILEIGILNKRFEVGALTVVTGGNNSGKAAMGEELSKFFEGVVYIDNDRIEIEEKEQRKSFMWNQYPEILKMFNEIAGGTYLFPPLGKIYFIPDSTKNQISIDFAYDSAKSLMDMAYYLQYKIDKNHIIVWNKPERNLHPENQCKVARFITSLVSAGIRMFISTHSDYLILEFNTLIMLHGKNNRDLLKRFGYNEWELLDPEKVRAYYAEKELTYRKNKLPDRYFKYMRPIPIDKDFGIAVNKMDRVIDKIRLVQDEIIYR